MRKGRSRACRDRNPRASACGRALGTSGSPWRAARPFKRAAPQRDGDSAQASPARMSALRRFAPRAASKPAHRRIFGESAQASVRDSPRREVAPQGRRQRRGAARPNTSPLGAASPACANAPPAAPASASAAAAAHATCAQPRLRATGRPEPVLPRRACGFEEPPPSAPSMRAAAAWRGAATLDWLRVGRFAPVLGGHARSAAAGGIRRRRLGLSWGESPEAVAANWPAAAMRRPWLREIWRGGRACLVEAGHAGVAAGGGGIARLRPAVILLHWRGVRAGGRGGRSRQIRPPCSAAPSQGHRQRRPPGKCHRALAAGKRARSARQGQRRRIVGARPGPVLRGGGRARPGWPCRGAVRGRRRGLARRRFGCGGCSSCEAVWTDSAKLRSPPAPGEPLKLQKTPASPGGAGESAAGRGGESGWQTDLRQFPEGNRANARAGPIRSCGRVGDCSWSGPRRVNFQT